MKKFDVHTHILPPDIPNFKHRFGYGGFIKFDKNSTENDRHLMFDDGRTIFKTTPNFWDPVARLQDMDAANIQTQAISPMPTVFYYGIKEQDAIETSKFFNDSIALVTKHNNERFVGLGTLPMQDTAAAVQEIKRGALELGLAGFEIGPFVGDWNLDDPRFDPIYTTAEELNMALFVHPTGIENQGRKGHYMLPSLVAMPAETASAIACILMGGVLERHPKLRFCFAHGGGAYPFIKGRIDRGHQFYPQQCAGKCIEKPSNFVGRFWVDSNVYSKDSLKFLIEAIGEDRIVLGSDYPVAFGENPPGELIETTIGADSTKERLLWKNAIEYLGLNSKCEHLPNVSKY